jgi:hypothetical protein
MRPIDTAQARRSARHRPSGSRIKLATKPVKAILQVIRRLPMASQSVSDFGGPFENEEQAVREAISTISQREDDLAAIKAGLEDMNAGRYRPLAEVDAEIRKELGFSTGDE